MTIGGQLVVPVVQKNVKEEGVTMSSAVKSNVSQDGNTQAQENYGMMDTRRKFESVENYLREAGFEVGDTRYY